MLEISFRRRGHVYIMLFINVYRSKISQTPAVQPYIFTVYWWGDPLSLGSEMNTQCDYSWNWCTSVEPTEIFVFVVLKIVLQYLLIHLFFILFFLFNSSFANCVELLLLLFAIIYDMWGISDSNTIVRVKYEIHFLYEEGYSVELHIFMPFMWKRDFMCE